MISVHAASRNDVRQAGRSRVLVLNAGSSSLKVALYRFDDEFQPVWRGKVEQVGANDATFTAHDAAEGKPARESLGQLTQDETLGAVLERVAGALNDAELVAVGHRVVHGGPDFFAPVLVNSEVLDRLRAMEPYDPAHQAVELAHIDSIAHRWPDVPQVACFDTAFHHDLPSVAQRLPVSRHDAARGLRRYGFHGLSYTHLMGELRRIAGKDAANGRLILAHLGNGASLAAVRNGQCVETTMGLTPTGGFPMSSRSGDLDPGVFLWLARHHSLSIEALFEMATRQSGLLAISETTADLRQLLERESSDARAAEAVELFCYSVRKSIGALAAALGGVDSLVFTGGIGEHQPVVRERVCTGLGFLGVAVDPVRNAQNAPLISGEDAAVQVHVIPADEERIIARAVRDLLQLQNSRG